MLLNADQIYDQIIPNENLCEKAQVGVDLTLKEVYILKNSSFIITKDNSFFSKKMSETQKLTVNNEGFYELKPGVYSIIFNEGLKNLQPDQTAFIYQRSTLGRNGILIRSSVYDPGFGTPEMGAIMYVTSKGLIEKDARVAQILIMQNVPVNNLYDGSYNNKKTL